MKEGEKEVRDALTNNDLGRAFVVVIGQPRFSAAEVNTLSGAKPLQQARHDIWKV